MTYEEAYKMAEQFAREFFWSKGYEVLFAVHTDTDHIHAHFLVSNCNQKDGTSFRRGPKELVEMSKYLGNQCRERGLVILFEILITAKIRTGKKSLLQTSDEEGVENCHLRMRLKRISGLQ